MKKQINLVLAIALLIVIGGGSFYGGTIYQKSHGNQIRGNFANRNMRTPDQTNRQTGIAPVSGQIVSLDDKSATIKLKDGGSKIILFSDSTVFNKNTTGSKSDLTQNEQIMVTGSQNSDGSITAQTLNIGGGLNRF